MPFTPIPVSNLTQQVIRSLDTQGSDAQASRELVARLKVAARQGDREAVELLGNLALSVTGDRRAIAEQATQALLEVSTDPQVHNAVRSSIQQFSFAAFEMTQKRHEKKSEGTLGDPPFKVPTPLLALALRQAQASGYRARATEIGTALQDRVRLEDSAGVMASADRFCLAEEILNTLSLPGQRRSSADAFSIASQPLDSRHHDFDARFREVAQRALQSAKPQAALILDGGHWVFAVVGPSGQGAGKVDVVVYDTLHESDHDKTIALTARLKTALALQTCERLVFVGGNVQGTTNGCGPLCMRALRGLGDHLAANPRKKSMEDVAAFLRDDLQAMRVWSSEMLAGIVAGLRGQMLGANERTDPSEANFLRVDQPAASPSPLTDRNAHSHGDPVALHWHVPLPSYKQAADSQPVRWHQAPESATKEASK
jgi:hypothetical protein